MKRSMIALGCILVAGPALAQSVGEKTGVNSALGISPTTADFIKEAANSDILEIAAASSRWRRVTPRRRSLPIK